MCFCSPARNWQRLLNLGQWDVPGTVPPTSLSTTRWGHAPARPSPVPFLLPATLAKPWVVWLSIAAHSHGAKNLLPTLGMATFGMCQREKSQVGSAGHGQPLPMAVHAAGGTFWLLVHCFYFFFLAGGFPKCCFCPNSMGAECIHEGISPAWLCAPRDFPGRVWGDQHCALGEWRDVPDCRGSIRPRDQMNGLPAPPAAQ